MTKIPSFIDMHVHLRDPGYTNKETIETGLNAAINGGFGAVCAMPNTNPVNDKPDIVELILKKAEKFKNEIVLYPVGAVTKGLNSDELVDFNKMKEKGCIAFSNDGMSTKRVEDALKTGELILSHLEDETNEAKEQTEIFSKLVKSGYKPKLHFCHISKKETVELIKKAKKEGLKITAETCPHYFTFTKENLDETGRFKMNPPLGTMEDKIAIIEGVKDGTIDVISTDHAPHTKEEKLMPYDKSPNGIVGLETAFSLAYMTFGLDITLEKMAFAPRRILNIDIKKEIEVDLDTKWRVVGSNFKSMCKITPYEGMELKGKVL